MRPLRVRMQAFGPFAAEQVLDFADLHGQRFFLITGPTGAGKSTVLDAMCFALYGDTSGDTRQARDMRSQHAAPGVLTEVEFDFAVGDDVYRIRRVPQQERPKKSGEGTTTELQNATMWRLDGDRAEAEGRPLATGWGPVSAKAEGVLGFRGDQFRQVVMLPQGRFQELLQADSRARETILATLFETAFFQRVEAALKESAGELSKHHDELGMRVEALLGQSQVAGREELALKRSRTSAAAIEAASALAAAEGLRTSAARAARAAEADVEKLEALATESAALALLESRAAEIEARRAELGAALRAAGLVAEEGAARQRRQEHEAAAAAAAAASAALEAAVEAVDRTAAELETERSREPERDHARGEAHRLRALAPKVAALDEARRAAAAGAAAAAEAAAAAVASRARGAAAEARSLTSRAALEATRETAGSAAALGDVAAARLAAAQRRNELITAEAALVEAEARSDELGGEVAAAVERHASASTEAARVEAVWQAGQAALLAAGLEPGAPCPVCGSTEHPQPAVSGREVPTDAALEGAREQRDERSAELDKARAAAASAAAETRSLHATVTQLEATLGELSRRSLEACWAEAAECTLQAAAARKAEAALPAMQAASESSAADLLTAAAALQSAEEQSRETGAAAKTGAAVLAEREREIPVGLRGPGALDAAVAAAVAAEEVLERAFETARELATHAEGEHLGAMASAAAAHAREREAAEAASAAQDHLAARLTAEGFADVAAWRAALREPSVIAQLEAEIDAYATALAGAGARVRQAQEAAAGLELPDVEALLAAERLSQDAARDAAAAEAGLDAELQRLDLAIARLAELDREAAEVRADYEVLGRVADVANGRNELKLSLQRFVLAAHLDAVLIVASRRLKTMSNGRYELERTDASAGRGRAAGLELEVFDAWTGELRPVTTLSGGETFLASLALALALAEVVQSYAGGIRLDTIFVDEGFGSLDPEALDLALDTLTALQEGGRLVGIISHLSEVRERIATRLEVSSDKNGSAARFVVP